eukprot:UN23194
MEIFDTYYPDYFSVLNDGSGHVPEVITVNLFLENYFNYLCGFSGEHEKDNSYNHMYRYFIDNGLVYDNLDSISYCIMASILWKIGEHEKMLEILHHNRKERGLSAKDYFDIIEDEPNGKWKNLIQHHKHLNIADDIEYNYSMVIYYLQKSKQADRAVNLFELLYDIKQNRNQSPNIETYNAAMYAYGKNMQWEKSVIYSITFQRKQEIYVHIMHS